LTGTGVANSAFNPSLANVGVNTITANYTDANGCQGSAQLSIIVEQCASVQENANGLIQIYPNPSEGELSISGFKGIAKVVIKDFNGKVVFRKDNFIEQDKINLSDYANGAYFVEIEGENQEKISKKLFLIR
jgi:hypothetical protein